ncbi:Protein of unknown function [Gryllus bimaculatus]|nr:Protein of unknown function [Gryllus bimaculatus]
MLSRGFAVVSARCDRVGGWEWAIRTTPTSRRPPEAPRCWAVNNIVLWFDHCCKKEAFISRVKANASIVPKQQIRWIHSRPRLRSQSFAPAPEERQTSRDVVRLPTTTVMSIQSWQLAS